MQNISTIPLLDIIPDFPLYPAPAHIQQFANEIQDLLLQRIPKNASPDHFPVIIPHVIKEDPLTLSLVVICQFQPDLQTEDYVKQMLLTSLLPDRNVHLVSSRYLKFSLEKTSYCAVELIVEIEQSNAPSLNKALPQFLKQLDAGLNTVHASYSLQGVPTNPSDSLVLTRIARYARRHPDSAEKMYSSALQFLLPCSPRFKTIRSTTHLTRVVIAHYALKEMVVQSADKDPQRRHLYLKLMRTQLTFPFKTQTALGILISFNLMHNREVLAEHPILEIVKKVLPNAKIVQGSFLERQDQTDQVQTTYLEIQQQHQSFTPEEIQKLQHAFSEELKESIEQHVPATFMHRNEEEIFHNILLLHEEIRSHRKLPQVAITFEEQTHTDLVFTVILVRVCKKDAPSIQELFVAKNPDIIFLPDRITILETIRKNSYVEANVFRLQLPKEQFFRKNRSLNLYKARCQIWELLTGALGILRDYNGGLIFKQNEKFETFLQSMREDNKSYDPFLLENFFYSMTPIVMQSLIPTSVIQAWFSLFVQIGQEEQPVVSHLKQDHYLCIAIRTDEPSFKKELMHELHKALPSSYQPTFAEIRLHDNYCLGVLYNLLQIKEESSVLHVIQKCVSDWTLRNLQQQHLRLSLKTHDPSLDPRIVSSDQSYLIIKMLYEGLSRIGPDGTPQLALAESFEVSADYRTYTFHLRDAHWSNGQQVTAHDFEYSWKTALAPSAHSVYSYSLYVIKNARRAKEKKALIHEVGIHAVDEKTLIVELEYPTPHFLELTAHWTYCLINSLVDRKSPEWAYQSGENFVCNGPFKLADWKHERTIEIVKNPYYWDAANVKLDRITLFLMNSQEQQHELFCESKLDLIGRPMSEFPVGIVPKEDEDLVSYPLSGIYTLWFNQKKFPFCNRKIRQALSLAIDRSALQKDVEHELLCWTDSIFPSAALCRKPENRYPEANLAKARQLFQEGLQELGTTAADLPPIYLSYATGMHREEMLAEIQRQWQSAFEFLQVFIEGVEWKVYYNQFVKGNYQIGGMELNCWWKDPFHILDNFTLCSDDQNVTGWDHPRLNEIAEQAFHTLDLAKREKLIEEIEKIFHEEMPVIPLYEFKGNFIKKKYLKDVYLSPFFEIDFKSAYLDKQL